MSAAEQFLGNGTLVFDSPAIVGNSITLILAIAGLFGISLVFYSSFFFSHTPHQMLILSLCSADYIFCLTSVINISFNLGQGGWLSGQTGLFICMTSAWVNMTTVIVSTISYTMIALERYCVIFRSLSSHETNTRIIIIVFWILAGITGFAASNSAQKAVIFPSKIVCGTNSSLGFYAVYPFFALSPAIMVYCYYSIFKFYSQKQVDSRLANQEDSKTIATKERLLFYKLLTITGSFLFFFMPFILIKIYSMVTQTTISPLADSIRTIFLICNATVNPIILYKYDPQIKNQIDAIFHLDVIIESAPRMSARRGSAAGVLGSSKISKSRNPSVAVPIAMQDRDTVKFLL
jgi:7 transmembrane receptor (rhodopsin family)